MRLARGRSAVAGTADRLPAFDSPLRLQQIVALLQPDLFRFQTYRRDELAAQRHQQDVRVQHHFQQIVDPGRQHPADLAQRTSIRAHDREADQLEVVEGPRREWRQLRFFAEERRADQLLGGIAVADLFEEEQEPLVMRPRAANRQCRSAGLFQVDLGARLESTRVAAESFDRDLTPHAEDAMDAPYGNALSSA